jgi:hypothetical protein
MRGGERKRGEGRVEGRWEVERGILEGRRGRKQKGK